MAQPRIVRFIAQVLLGLLLLAWLPAVGNASETPFLPQAEEALSFAHPSDEGEGGRETFGDQRDDGAGALLLAGCRSTMGGGGEVLPQRLRDASPGLDFREAWRATGPPALRA